MKLRTILRIESGIQMAYSQALVIAGGLAHIPVITSLFWVVDQRSKKSLVKETPSKAPKKKVSKPEVQKLPDIEPKELEKPIEEEVITGEIDVSEIKETAQQVEGSSIEEENMTNDANLDSNEEVDEKITAEDNSALNKDQI